MRFYGLAPLLGTLVWLTACGSDPQDSPSDPLPGTSTGTGASGGDGSGAEGGTGAQGGSGASGGSSSGGSGGTGNTGGCGGSGTPAEIVTQGQADKILLQGMIVTPSEAFAGEVLIEGNLITCVAASCASEPGAAGASVVATHGIVMPGLIDAHNHILYDVFDEDDWAPTQTYQNHDQWPNDPRYGAMVDAKQYLNGEGSSVDFGCELDKYGELKGLVAGTTAIQGSATPGNKVCYGSLARTIDQTPNDLPDDQMQTATIFPSTSSADGVCTNFGDGDTTAYVIHVGEGVDSTSLNEFAKLGTVTTTDNCLYSPKTTIIHGTAFGDAQLTTMGQNGMSLVWSPRSNVFLYGGGTDLSKTTNVPLARSKGVNVALGPDWSLGGSQNLLDELRYANEVDDTEWGDVLDAKALVEMVTTNAAKALGLSAYIGSLAPGKRADVLVIGGDTQAPYDALLAATPVDVRLVIVDGKPLYGDPALQPLAPQTPGCEPLDICCADKFVCVAEAGGTATDKLGQTYTEIVDALEAAFTDYDALDLSQWDFAPVAPLVKCP